MRIDKLTQAILDTVHRHQDLYDYSGTEITYALESALRLKEIELGKTPVKRFKPPTLQEVGKYIKENSLNVDVEKWYNFYRAKNWMIGKNKMANWKNAINTWHDPSRKKDLQLHQI